VVVRINDRVPKTAKLPVDLSRGSARAIGMTGIATVALYEAE
jgi:rare lipoprotein A (peptidoglycan hydrolase)